MCESVNVASQTYSTQLSTDQMSARKAEMIGFGLNIFLVVINVFHFLASLGNDRVLSAEFQSSLQYALMSNGRDIVFTGLFSMF